MDMLQRKSSIETEPMTLRLDQIENAREEAMYVMKTKTMEEAMSIFTKGMRRDEDERGRCIDMKNDGDYDHDEVDDEDEKLMFLSPHGWDIASAPF